MDHDDRGDGSRVMSNPNFHTTGAHYLNADTTAFMQLIQGDLSPNSPAIGLVVIAPLSERLSGLLLAPTSIDGLTSGSTGWISQSVYLGDGNTS